MPQSFWEIKSTIQSKIVRKKYVQDVCKDFGNQQKKKNTPLIGGAKRLWSMDYANSKRGWDWTCAWETEEHVRRVADTNSTISTGSSTGFFPARFFIWQLRLDTNPDDRGLKTSVGRPVYVKFHQADKHSKTTWQLRKLSDQRNFLKLYEMRQNPSIMLRCPISKSPTSLYEWIRVWTDECGNQWLWRYW